MFIVFLRISNHIKIIDTNYINFIILIELIILI
jgi:hypothetical protein